MQTIEIKPNKNLFRIFIGVIVLAAIATTIYVFIAANTLMKLLYVGLAGYLIYSFRDIVNRIKLNKAAITLSGDSISFYDKETAYVFKWSDIRDVSLLTDENTSYLILKTTTGENKIGVSWLDKSPDNIKELVDEYRNNAVRKSIV